MGFRHIVPVDDDELDASSLNRVAGVDYKDAQNNVYKVGAIANRLRGINPKCEAEAYRISVHSTAAEIALAQANWILAGTDSHSSRFRVQQYAFKYFAPFIAAGVNISVEGDIITVVSGEAIAVRMGGAYCLSCLNRVNYTAFHIKSPNVHFEKSQNI
jgi:molybdopterin/thiamine biosynthesis adenylyltransferase